MQTSFHSAVSQYAKTDFPTSKPNTTKDLELRQQDKNLLHTPTHPPTDGAGTGENLLTADLKKIIDFIILVKSLYPQYYVSFSVHHYLKAHFTNCCKEKFDLFFSLVQAFTLLHHHQRKTSLETVLVTAEADYVEAFELWQKYQPNQRHQKAEKVIQKVIQLLVLHYENKLFTITQIALQLNYSAGYMSTIFEELQQQNRIELVTNKNKFTKKYTFKLCA